ncbi:MAG: hypothetical protein ACO3RV_05450, partial [Luteolibacter sp.]
DRLALQAFNSAGLYSDLSEEIVITTAPAAPSGWTLTGPQGNLLPPTGGTLDLGYSPPGEASGILELSLSYLGPGTRSGLHWRIEDAGALQFELEGMPTRAVMNSNGSFENDFASWATSGQVRTRESADATDGSWQVDFSHGNGPNDGAIQCVIPTVPGNLHRLEFDLGLLNYNKSEQRLRLVASGVQTLIDDTLSIVGIGDGLTKWQPASYDFIADSNRTTLRFEDVSSVTYGVDLALDNIRVSDLVLSSMDDSFTLEEGQTASIRLRYRPQDLDLHQAALILVDPTAAVAPYRIALSGASSMNYADWLLRFYPAGDPYQNEQGSPLLKYAFGTRPEFVASPLAIEGGIITQRGNPALLMPDLSDPSSVKGRFLRKKDREMNGLAYYPQFSSDLIQWHDALSTPEVEAEDAELEAVSVRSPDHLTGSAAQFFRVIVELTPPT